MRTASRARSTGDVGILPPGSVVPTARLSWNIGRRATFGVSAAALTNVRPGTSAFTVGLIAEGPAAGAEPTGGADIVRPLVNNAAPELTVW